MIAERYRLQRVIGHGSMGVVWLGYDELLHRAVAVKEVRLPPGMPAPEATELRQRTLREARAAAALQHPNVISVFDVARRGDDPFVVMELLRSRSLADLLKRLDRCDAVQVASVADAVAAALEAAHRRGVTHRDVKPGNVLVGDDGQIKLTDFGIARNLAEVTMTASGMIMGTPAYIAPEVAAGEPVTPAADLWSLGATLFAAVAGHPPYDKGDALATIVEVVQGEVPALPDGAPLADVIGALMVKDPAGRIGLTEVRRRIRPLLPEPGTRVFPPDDEEASSGPADNKPTDKFRPTAEPEPADVGTWESGGVLASPPLAADPGPLPFGSQPAPPLVPRLAVEPGPLPFDRPAAPPARRRRRRGALANAMLSLVAVLLFVAAAGGGFAGARMLGGQPLLPPTGTTTSNPPTSMPPGTAVGPVPLAPVQSWAAPRNGQGGNFSVSAPAGWTEFREQKPATSMLPASVAVHFVSPDGTAELTVERLPNFYPRRDIRNYEQALTSGWQGLLTIASTQQISGQGNDFDNPTEINYNTADSGGETGNEAWLHSARRTTFADLLPRGDDLWVLSVTVPTDQQDAGQRNLFDKIKGTLSVTS